MEGIVDQQMQGFASSQLSQLRNYSSPLQLIANYDTDMIFGDYEVRREVILKKLLNK
jgi:hypothetical protein